MESLSSSHCHQEIVFNETCGGVAQAQDHIDSRLQFSPHLTPVRHEFFEREHLTSKENTARINSLLIRFADCYRGVQNIRAPRW